MLLLGHSDEAQNLLPRCKITTLCKHTVDILPYQALENACMQYTASPTLAFKAQTV